MTYKVEAKTNPDVTPEIIDASDRLFSLARRRAVGRAGLIAVSSHGTELTFDSSDGRFKRNFMYCEQTPTGLDVGYEFSEIDYNGCLSLVIRGVQRARALHVPDNGVLREVFVGGYSPASYLELDIVTRLVSLIENEELDAERAAELLAGLSDEEARGYEEFLDIEARIRADAGSGCLDRPIFDARRRWPNSRVPFSLF